MTGDPYQITSLIHDDPLAKMIFDRLKVAVEENTMLRYVNSDRGVDGSYKILFRTDSTTNHKFYHAVRFLAPQYLRVAIPKHLLGSSGGATIEDVHGFGWVVVIHVKTNLPEHEIPSGTQPTMSCALRTWGATLMRDVADSVEHVMFTIMDGPNRYPSLGAFSLFFPGMDQRIRQEMQQVRFSTTVIDRESQAIFADECVHGMIEILKSVQEQVDGILFNSALAEASAEAGS